ncbi:ABC-2 family transporter protein [Singulisphaera sp. GP187]|uniref:ABC transporter permease n=1 Tax=Singulisphaera sp. GP187 TaxID=1882752 RepID=UPI000926F7AC|nr:ABC transporter permease subunit [Singulisphaera sp. GP187]SIO07745.1 ABC-2 family transporter protein [Singulisphaera sp. GP187]
MLPGPVFNAELLTTARRTRYFVVRFIYGAILLYFIWRNDPDHGAWGFRRTAGELSIREMARLGWALFLTILIVQSVAVLLLTPTLVAGVIAEERQRKTLHYLLASRLSSGEIILGKLAARMLHLGVFVAIGLPITSLLSLFGGVDPNLVLLSFAVTATTAFFLAALSILVSTHARRPREAISLVYLLEFCWLFGPTFIQILMPMGGPRWVQLYEWIKPINEWIAPTSPFAFARGGALNASAILDLFGWMMGLQAAYGILFVVIALLRLRGINRRDGEGRLTARFAAFRHGRRLLPRPECGDDAMMWKERYVSRTNLVTKIAVIVIVFAVLCGLGYLTYDFGKPAFVELAANGYGPFHSDPARREFNGYLRVVCTLMYVLLAMAVASSASSGLTSEREEDTWISLVATPLDGLEIIRAKMVGALWAQRWLVGVLVLHWLIGLAAGSIHPLGVLAVALETMVYLWFAVALGTYYSLRSKTSARALVATIGTMILVNGAYLMCCIPSWTSNWLQSVGVTPMVEAISLFSFADFRDLSLGRVRGRGSWESVEMIAAGFVSVLCYTVAALVLTLRALDRFDIEAGRPSREDAIPPATLMAFDDVSEEKEVGDRQDEILS